MSKPSTKIDLLTTVGGTSLAVFGALWTLLEPLDAFDAVVDKSSKRLLTYIVLILLSLGVGALVGLWRAVAHGRRGDGRTVASSRLDLSVVQELSRANRRVLIVGLSIPTFSSEQALRTYDALLGRGVQIDLVLVNPFSPSLLQRPRALYNSISHVSVTAARTLNALTQYATHLSATQRTHFRTHITNALPTAGIVVVDGDCIWHPYLNQSTGASSPYIRESVSEGYGPYILRYAESLITRPNSFEATRDFDALLRELTDDRNVSFAFTAQELDTIRKALAE